MGVSTENKIPAPLLFFKGVMEALANVGLPPNGTPFPAKTTATTLYMPVNEGLKLHTCVPRITDHLINEQVMYKHMKRRRLEDPLGVTHLETYDWRRLGLVISHLRA